MPTSDSVDPTPHDRPGIPPDPGESPDDPPADERPAGALARMVLVATPFALLALLYLLDRLFRG
jgi:hypothetical protein